MGFALVLLVTPPLMYAEKTGVLSSILYLLTVDKAVGSFWFNQLLNHPTG
jgi:hypothetical protein